LHISGPLIICPSIVQPAKFSNPSPVAHRYSTPINHVTCMVAKSITRTACTHILSPRFSGPQCTRLLRRNNILQYPSGNGEHTRVCLLGQIDNTVDSCRTNKPIRTGIGTASYNACVSRAPVSSPVHAPARACVKESFRSNRRTICRRKKKHSTNTSVRENDNNRNTKCIK
jgi:hypothetical protein